MEAKRWIEFRTELYKIYVDMINEAGNPSVVEKHFQNLVDHYPEMHKVEVKEIKQEANPELFALHKVAKEIEVKIKQEANSELLASYKVEVKEIKQEVNEEEQDLKNKDPTQHVEVNTETEQDCLDTLSIVNKTIIETRKQIIYLRSLQGEVLNKLRELTNCSMNDLIKKTDYSPSPYSLEFV